MMTSQYLESYKSKIFHLKYFWLTFRKSQNVSAQIKIDFYLTKVLLKISKKDIKRKKSKRSNPKNCLPEEAPKDTSPSKSLDFSEAGIGVGKIAFSLERR